MTVSRLNTYEIFGSQNSSNDIQSNDFKSDSEVGHGSYRELRSIVVKAGLLDRQFRYYGFKIISLILMMAAGIAMLVLIGDSWWQIFTAIYIAAVAMQTALIGHDAGHRQIFRSTTRNDFVALLITSPFLGFNLSWWLDQHNKHHGTPNHEDLDPNINVGFWVFTDKHRKTRSGFYRSMAKYQAILIIPLNMIGGFYKVVESARFLKDHQLRYPIAERVAFVLFVAWSFSLPFIFLTPIQAIVFIFVYYAVLGLYFGAIISPNHKGMLMVTENQRLDFLRGQVLTSRNIRSHPITDFFYGGLNYQIEHHLFPNMPRNRLRDAVSIVRGYCAEHDIPYHETSILEGFKELLTEMHRASAPLRAESSPTAGVPIDDAGRNSTSAIRAGFK